MNDMETNTQIRKKKEWLKDNVLRIVGISLVGILAFFGKWGFGELTEMRTQMSTLTQEVKDLRSRELDLIWETMRDFGAKIEDSRVKIMVIDEIYARQAYSYPALAGTNAPANNAPLTPDEIKRRLVEEIQREMEYENDHHDFKQQQELKGGWKGGK